MGENTTEVLLSSYNIEYYTVLYDIVNKSVFFRKSESVPEFYSDRGPNEMHSLS